MKTKVLSAVSLALALAFAFAAYKTADFWRDLHFSLFGTALSLSIGLVVVNLYLNTEERKRAAMPLLEMIVPDVRKYHNEFLIHKGRLAFGMEAFNKLLETYSKHKGNPASFSPEQRDTLYATIAEQKEAILELLPRLEGKFKEVASLVGLSYEPSIVTAILVCRRNIQSFQNLAFDGSLQCKLDACEHFLDIDSSSSEVLQILMKILGKKDKDWQAVDSN